MPGARLKPYRSCAGAVALIVAFGIVPVVEAADCSGLPSHSALVSALRSSVAASGGPSNGGFDLNMWATIVNREGEVCAIAHTGKGPGDQWPGSRVISAQKANTANAFSLPSLALSTANLWAATQPGGSLFGLQFSNPVDPALAYAGKASDYGTPKDALVGKKIGGINVFGGGLALYGPSGIVGGLGVSGDSSCADHNVAWRTRNALGLGKVPAGVGPNGTDGINYDLDASGKSAGGFGHPRCGKPGSPGKEDEVAVEIGAGGPSDQVP